MQIYHFCFYHTNLHEPWDFYFLSFCTYTWQCLPNNSFLYQICISTSMYSISISQAIFSLKQILKCIWEKVLHFKLIVSIKGSPRCCQMKSCLKSKFWNQENWIVTSQILYNSASSCSHVKDGEMISGINLLTTLKQDNFTRCRFLLILREACCIVKIYVFHILNIILLSSIYIIRYGHEL